MFDLKYLWKTSRHTKEKIDLTKIKIRKEIRKIEIMHACMLSHFSHVQLCATPWTAAHQAPLSTGFFRQEYWSWVAMSFFLYVKFMYFFVFLDINLLSEISFTNNFSHSVGHLLILLVASSAVKSL